MNDALTPQARNRRFADYVAAAARAAGYDIDTPRGGGRKALAADSGMSPSSVGRMLAGQTMPDPTLFEALARALRVPVGELLVLSGLLSQHNLDAVQQQATTPPEHPLSPRAAAADLGITDPVKIEAFEAMVRALLDTQDDDSRDDPGKGHAA